MNELELKKLWQTSNEKIEENFVINKRNTQDITRLKVRNLLGSMKPLKIFALIIGFLWVGIGSIVLGSIYINSFSDANKFFLYSGSIQIGLTAMAIFVYLYQLITIYQVDSTDSIINTQKKLSSLQISTLWVNRILYLQLPVWTTIWWSETIISNWGILQWSIRMFFTVTFTIAAFWLFLNIKYENRNKKWFKLILNGKEWTPLMKSMELLEQVEEYKEEKPTTSNKI